MLLVLVCLSAGLVAYANGANDNFKGVASLFGSRTCDYRLALAWATLTTFAGSLTAIYLAQELLSRFSGQGLVPEDLLATPGFVVAVAFGAGATVMLAALSGFPISTTHSLLGGLVGAGWMAVGAQLNAGVLGKYFVAPLLLSPLLAMAVGAVCYLLLRWTRLQAGLRKELCVCAGVEEQVVPLPQPASVMAAQALPTVSVTIDQPASCTQRYAGRVLGIGVGQLLDAFHFLSAGAVSFARGLNDTPKIAALLLVVGALDIRWGLVGVAVAMAAGGLLHGRRVARTMSDKITSMSPSQGFAANLATALLVTTASVHGLPVSTTHVSVGSLVGMGVVTRQAHGTSVLTVLAAWVITLPCAFVFAAGAFWLLGTR